MAGGNVLQQGLVFVIHNWNEAAYLIGITWSMAPLTEEREVKVLNLILNLVHPPGQKWNFIVNGPNSYYRYSLKVSSYRTAAFVMFI